MNIGAYLSRSMSSLSSLFSRVGKQRHSEMPQSFPERLGRMRLLRTGEYPHPKEPVVVAVMRNEARVIPEFLDHYRKLEVRNLVFVDNDSTDRSVALCSACDDLNVTIYGTSQRYRNSRSGLNWVNAIISHLRRFGHYWVLVVDLDEFLVYPGCEFISLGRLGAFLDKEGCDAMSTPLLDMYPDGDIHAAEGAFSVADSCYYDAAGYEFAGAARFPLFQLVGGARRRYCEDARFSLKKVAFFNTRADVLPVVSTHAYTGRMDMAWVTGALLHYKFAASFVAKVRSEATEKRRTQTQDYERYNEQLSNSCNLHDSVLSHEYKDSLSLVGDRIIWADGGYVRHFRKSLPAAWVDRCEQMTTKNSDRTLEQLVDIMPVISSSTFRY